MVVLGLTVGCWVLCGYIDRFSGGGFGCLRLVVGLLLYFVLLACVGVSGLVVSFLYYVGAGWVCAFGICCFGVGHVV